MQYNYNICISSLSWHVTRMDFPDPLLPLVPIVNRSW